jgi:SAM-dependent methyltransferase
VKDKETSYWDYWNTQHRRGAIDANSTPGQLGAVIMREISSLGLTKPRVVEIGCGTGWFAERIVDCGSYFGLDISPDSIELAQSRVPGARFLARDFLAWDSEGELFDIALLVDSIAYFRDQDLAVAKTFQLLDRSGYLVLSTVK